MLPENPLPACPSSPNCYRESRAFDRAPEDVFNAAVETIRHLSGLTIGRAIEIERDGLALHAPFRVFVFTDDLHLHIDRHGEGAVVHLRSASRVGHSDLGTNRRRVRALLNALTDWQRSETPLKPV